MFSRILNRARITRSVHVCHTEKSNYQAFKKIHCVMIGWLLVIQTKYFIHVQSSCLCVFCITFINISNRDANFFWWKKPNNSVKNTHFPLLQ